MKRLIAICSAVIGLSAVSALAQQTEGTSGLNLGPDADSLFGETMLDKAILGGSWKAELGMSFRFVDPDNSSDDGDAGWGYIEFDWLSGSFHGLQLGLGGLAVTELWESGDFDGVIDDAFADKAKWTDAYVKFSIPNTKSNVIVGRKKFKKPASGDGDVHQGIQLTIKDIPHLTIYAHAVNAWMNNASSDWDLDGIQEDWQDLEDTIRDNGGPDEDAGEFAYTVMAAIDVVPGHISITPYITHHGDVATTIGSTFEAKTDVNETFSVGLDGAYARHMEDTPDDVCDTDGDVSQTLVQVYGKACNFKLGVGYYTMSKDASIGNSLTSGDDFDDNYAYDEFDPMELDLAKYGEQPNNETWFIFGGYSWGAFDLEVTYGWVDDAIVEKGSTYDGEATELDVVLGVGITENLSLELAYIHLDDDFKDDGDRSQDVFAGNLAYKF